MPAAQHSGSDADRRPPQDRAESRAHADPVRRIRALPPDLHRWTPSSPPLNPAWLGYSIGKWEGDWFVVDTRGFNDKSWLDDSGRPHSEALRTIERFRRRDFGHMDVEITIDDPESVHQALVTIPHAVRFLADTDMIEDVCDNEKDAAHTVK